MSQKNVDHLKNGDEDGTGMGPSCVGQKKGKKRK
jgi:hypothetical protein